MLSTAIRCQGRADSFTLLTSGAVLRGLVLLVLLKTASTNGCGTVADGGSTVTKGWQVGDVCFGTT